MSRYQDVCIAGFGGQGVLLIGNLLAQAGMEAGLNVTFLPVYGAEMRGGTANCTVVMDDLPIGSPAVRTFQSTIVLNQPSLEKFQSRLRENGVQIVNTSLINEDVIDPAIRTVRIPVTDMAYELGSPRLLNMIALGAYLKASSALPLDAVTKALSSVVSARNAHLIPKNIAALEAGFAF